MNGHFFELKLFGEDITTDTFITDSTLSNKKSWDREIGGYVHIPTTEADSKQLLKNRKYLKVGKNSNGKKYRSIVQFNIRKMISDSIGFAIVSIQKATITLTNISQEPITSLGCSSTISQKIDESATWYFSSQKQGKNWETMGGDFIRSNITHHSPTNQITIDVTQYFSNWYDGGKEEFTIFITENLPESNIVQTFHSSNSHSGIAGNVPQTNCIFQTGGNSHLIHTEGILVNITPLENQTSEIKLIDTSQNAKKQFYYFQKMMSVGKTFDMFDPDINNGISLQTKSCTILRKNDGDSIIVSGISLSTKHKTTIELIAIGKVASEDNFLEILNPSTKLIQDLKGDNKITINYKPKSINNNGDYIITNIVDDILVNNRILVFVKGKLFSENRMGLETKIIQKNVTPTLNVEMLLF